MPINIGIKIEGFDKKIIDPRVIRRNLTRAVDQTANIVRDDFKRTVRTWRTKAAFAKRGPIQKIDNIEAKVSTNSEIYLFLDKGTRKNYPIPKSGTANLRFRSGYTAKTRVRVIGSRGGGASGPFVHRRRVIHPGIKAREFSLTIAKRRLRNLRNLTRLAFLRSLRR
jgi:hypothetical protein